MPWRVGRTGRAREQAAAPELPAPERVRFLESDRFLDLVVLSSVLMFLVLAAGIGMLALQASSLR